MPLVELPLKKEDIKHRRKRKKQNGRDKDGI
jgi:hypothetical protein